MPRKSNLWPHIITPESPQNRRVDKKKHVESPRVIIIQQPTPVLPTRVTTARHQYNIQTRRKIAYSFTKTGKFSLYSNIITAMEANAVVHLGVSQEYRHLITRDKRITWKISFINKLGHLDQEIRDIKGTNTIVFISNHEVPFTTKKVTYGKKMCDINPD